MSVKRVEVVERSYKNILLPLLSSESWIFVKETQVEKENKKSFVPDLIPLYLFKGYSLPPTSIHFPLLPPPSPLSLLLSIPPSTIFILLILIDFVEGLFVPCLNSRYEELSIKKTNVWYQVNDYVCQPFSAASSSIKFY